MESQKKQKFGEQFVAQGLITTEQLQLALQRHIQVGGRLGSILLEMGFISVDDLLSFLSKQFHVPSINLFELDIPADVATILPWEKLDDLKIIPVKMEAHTITMAMENPNDFMSIEELEFRLGKRIKPAVAPEYMIEAALHVLLSNTESSLKGEDIANVAAAERKKTDKVLPLLSLLQKAVKLHASDILLTAGVPPSFKINSQLKRLSASPLTPIDTEKYAKELMTEKQLETFSNRHEMDIAIAYPNIGRFRTNLYRQRNSISITMRPIPERMLSLRELNLPEWVRDVALKPQGLVLISGPTGHGKSTTLYCMIDIINANRKRNIITFEDPIEFMHRHKKSNVNQREVGRDTKSFYEGLKYVMRQSPDVIVVGEMRDKESFEIALTAATTGHLVLSTIHANNSTSVIERVINMFSPHEQVTIRTMLADSLIVCMSQRLIPRKDGTGRILACEKLMATHSIRQLIRDDSMHKIRTQMQAGSQDFTSIDAALAELCKKGLIDYKAGMDFAEDSSYYCKLAGQNRGNYVKNSKQK